MFEPLDYDEAKKWYDSIKWEPSPYTQEEIDALSGVKCITTT